MRSNMILQNYMASSFETHHHEVHSLCYWHQAEEQTNSISKTKCSRELPDYTLTTYGVQMKSLDLCLCNFMWPEMVAGTRNFVWLTNLGIQAFETVALKEFNSARCIKGVDILLFQSETCARHNNQTLDEIKRK